MGPQILNICHNQIARFKNRHHLCQRRRLRTRKDTSFNPFVEGARGDLSNCVYKPSPFGAETSVYRLAQGVIVCRPDVFKHADGDEHIIRTAYITAIVFNIFNGMGQIFFLRLLPGIFDLTG